MRQPSEKQVAYVEGIREGKQPIQAAREAGYSEATAHNTKANIVDSPVIQSLLEDVKKEHLENGLNAKRMSDELKRLVEEEEWKPRLEGQKMWRVDMGLGSGEKQQVNLTQNNTYVFSQEIADASAEVIRRKLHESTNSRGSGSEQSTGLGDKPRG